MRKTVFLFYLLAVIWQYSVGQESRTVSGTVTGPNGPLAGVSVSVKSGMRQTATDQTGKYALDASDSDTLIFTNVGYEKQLVAVSGRNQVDVVLVPSTSSLDEVVVVGYGTQTRRNVTGSVAKVDMKQTENLPNTNVTQAIRGRVAGVQFTDNGRPGQDGSILIRGPRSLSGGNNPLIVLDGIFFNGSLTEINPNDILSMEILKDASAAAIYGSRAANGVILITSKRGTTAKPTINLNMFAGVSDWSYRVKLLSPERYIRKTLDYRTAMGMPANPADIADYLQPSEVPNYQSGKTTDPWDAISQQGRMSSIDVNVSGRSEATNYYLSASRQYEKGLIYNDNMERYSFRINLENDIASWLKIGVQSTYAKRDYSGVAGSVSLAYRASPYGTYYYEDGMPTQWIVPEDQITGNGMRSALLTKDEQIYNNLFANFFASIRPQAVEGLEYRINYSPNYRWRHGYTAFQQDPYFAGNTATASKANQENIDWVLENILTYSREFSQDHHVDVTLLYGLNHLGFESTAANASQLATDVLGWNNLALGSVLTNSSGAGASDGVSSMFRLNYQWLNRYLFTFTVRRDGSSVFAKNNKYATFPSASLAWIASDEPFFSDLDYLDLLKLRVSYGAVGNQAISPYQSLSRSLMTRYVFGDGGNTQIGIYPSTMENQNLKWETTYSTNVALDFEIFNSRISGTAEYYDMNTQDLLVERTLPAMSGYNMVWTNLGATSNKGFELSLTTANIRKDQFDWQSNFVFSTNRNKIVHLYRSDTDGDGKEDNDLGNLWFIGHPIDVGYDFVMDGIYQEGDELPTGYKPGFVRLKDLNNDGRITPADDRQIIGQTGQPRYRWGMTNTFRYRDISLSIFINAMQGWISTFNPLDMQYFIPGSGNYPNRPVNMIDYDDGWWTPENKSNTRPAIVYTNPYQHQYWLSRNFVRIQDISLSYSLPSRLLSRVGISSLRISASGKNLYTFTDWPGPDPESGYNTASNLYPSSRTFVLGLNLTF